MGQPESLGLGWFLFSMLLAVIPVYIFLVIGIFVNARKRK